MTSESKPLDVGAYTPGPWEIDPYDFTAIYGPSPKGRMRICDIRGWGHLTGKGSGALGLSQEHATSIQDANARLISAAPDLVEALRRVERWINTSVPIGTVAATTMHGVVRSALAKALGQEEGL